jgi:hypothetical protein
MWTRRGCQDADRDVSPFHRQDRFDQQFIVGQLDKAAIPERYVFRVVALIDEINTFPHVPINQGRERGIVGASIPSASWGV